MIILKSMLTEIVSNPIIELGQYLQMTDADKGVELAYDIFAEKIFDWIQDHYPQLYDHIEQFNDEPVMAVEWLEQHDPQIFRQFTKFIFNDGRDVDLFDHTKAGHPSWFYMNFERYIQNQWLIHFSDAAAYIWADQQFKYGVDDYTTLGLTTYYRQSGKEFGGYNFAYDISDFMKYGRSHYSSGEWKYGKEAVMFRASGVKVWHHGDEERQVIFWGRTAKDIVHIQMTDPGPWGVVNDRKKNSIFIGELPTVVNWVIANFNQYRNVLLPS